MECCSGGGYTGVYLRMNFRFLSVCLPDPSIRIRLLVELANLYDNPSSIPFPWVTAKLVLNSNSVTHFKWREAFSVFTPSFLLDGVLKGLSG